MAKKSQAISIDLLVTLGIFLILIIGIVFVQISNKTQNNSETKLILEKQTNIVNGALKYFRKNEILNSNNELDVEKFNNFKKDKNKYEGYQEVFIIKNGSFYNLSAD